MLLLEIIGENNIIIFFWELTVVIVIVSVKIWILIGRLARETLHRRNLIGRVFRMIHGVGWPGRLLARVQMIRIRRIILKSLVRMMVIGMRWMRDYGVRRRMTLNTVRRHPVKMLGPTVSAVKPRVSWMGIRMHRTPDKCRIMTWRDHSGTWRARKRDLFHFGLEHSWRSGR